MEDHSNPVFGRKVFFINPLFSVRSIVIEKLIEDEYEVCIISDYKDAKNVLRKFPDSICYINIDEQLNYDQWFNFIKSFEEDTVLRTIFLGVLSGNIKKSDRNMYMLKLNISAGFIMINEKLEDAVETIEHVLDINGAKGRRRYVRTSCIPDKDTFLLARSGVKIYKMKLLDISIVGCACALPLQYKDLFQTNSVLRNVSFSLGTKMFTCDAAVYAVPVMEKFCKLVVLFIPGVPNATKKIIHSYITERFNKSIAAIIEKSFPDTVDYSKAVQTKEQIQTDNAFLVDADEENISIHETASFAMPDFEGTTEDLTLTQFF